MTIEAMKKWLKALKNTLGFTGSREIDSATRQAITSLRQAIVDFEKQEQDEHTVALIKECRDAFAEELSAWDIDPPLHHIQQGHDNCVKWLAVQGIKENT